MNELISVIVPIYNVEPYLERCLDSVITNTYRNLEIICVNDGSLDNCQTILERYATQDDRIKVICQENRGVSAARNTGMDAATGDYLYFLDPDDWIHCDSFRFLLRAAKETDADVIVGGFTQVSREEDWDAGANLSYHKLGPMLFAEAIDKRYIGDMVWGRLFRRAVIMEHRYPEGIKAYGEDAFFSGLIVCCHENTTCVCVDLPLYAYFSRPGSILYGLTMDTRMRSIKCWVEQLDSFSNPGYAINWIFQALFLYERYGRYCINPQTAKRNAHIVRRHCLPYLWNCRNLSKKQKMKMVMNTIFPFLYYAIIKYRDPTYKIAEKISAEKNRDIVLKEWNEI